MTAALVLGDFTGAAAGVHKDHAVVGLPQGLKAVEGFPVAADVQVILCAQVEDHHQEQAFQAQLEVEKGGGVFGDGGAGNGDDTRPASVIDDIIILIVVLLAMPDERAAAGGEILIHPLEIVLLGELVQLAFDMFVLPDLLVQDYVAVLVDDGGRTGKKIAAFLPIHLDISRSDVQSQHADSVGKKHGEAENGRPVLVILVDLGAGTHAAACHGFEVPGAAGDIITRRRHPAAAVYGLAADIAVKAAFIIAHLGGISVRKLRQPLLHLTGGHALIQHRLHCVGGIAQDLGVFLQERVHLEIQVVSGHGTQLVGGAVCGSAGGIYAQKGGNAHQQQQNRALDQKTLDISFRLLHAARSLISWFSILYRVHVWMASVYGK